MEYRWKTFLKKQSTVGRKKLGEMNAGGIYVYMYICLYILSVCIYNCTTWFVYMKRYKIRFNPDQTGFGPVF